LEEQMMEMIKKNDNIDGIFRKYPSTRKVFINKSLRCVICEMNRFVTVEECCLNNKVKDVDGFVKLLNESVDEELIG
jgi:hypothetical protein